MVIEIDEPIEFAIEPKIYYIYIYFFYRERERAER